MRCGSCRPPRTVVGARNRPFVAVRSRSRIRLRLLLMMSLPLVTPRSGKRRARVGVGTRDALHTVAQIPDFARFRGYDERALLSDLLAGPECTAMTSREIATVAVPRASSRRRWLLGAATGVVTLALAVLAARHFATMSWPLSSRQPFVLVAAGFLLVLAQALKAFGLGTVVQPVRTPHVARARRGQRWRRARRRSPARPFRRCDARRRRAPVSRVRAGVRVLCLSLVMLGLIDSAAIAPLALAGAALPHVGAGIRTGLALVAAAGLVAGVLISLLPRLMNTGGRCVSASAAG